MRIKKEKDATKGHQSRSSKSFMFTYEKAHVYILICIKSKPTYTRLNHLK